jgi:uncharacterized protein
MIGVVLDTNVIVSANLNNHGAEAQVLALALNRKLKLHVSGPILEEYQRVLLYPRLKFVTQEVIAFLTLLRSVSKVVRPKRRLRLSPHPADNRFYECAEAAKAAFLVTGNRKHFPLDYKTTKVVNARELLEVLTLGRSLDI